MPAWTLTESADDFPAGGGPPPPDNWHNEGEDQVNALGGDDIVHGGLLNDTLTGGAGLDTLHGDEGGDVILGGIDDDDIFGGIGEDTLSGEDGIDTIHGDGDIDTISGGADGDVIFGDDGNDIINGDSGADDIEGGAGADTITTGTGSDTAQGGADGDTFGSVSEIDAAGDHDTLSGDAGDDVLLARGVPSDGWTASFDGGAGSDTVRAGSDIRHYTFLNVEVLENTFLIVADVARLNQFSLFTDTYAGSDTTSVFLKSSGAVDFSARLAAGVKLDVECDATGNTVTGGAENDRLKAFAVFGGGASSAALHLEGRGGADTLTGGTGNDYLDGGSGADDMTGDAGTNIYIIDNAGDAVHGDAGFDELRTLLNSYVGNAIAGSQFHEMIVFTGAGNFTGTGGNNDTILVGGAGDDVLNGGTSGFFSGNDTLIGGGGDDTLDGGGTGFDWADYGTATALVRVSLAIAGAQNTGASTGNDTLIAIDNLRGSGFGDTLTGDGGANTLEGGSGDDVLAGGPSGDLLTGGPGSDTASYAGAAARVKVALDGSIAFEGDALGDTFVSIARLTGTGSSDVLIGDVNGNVIRGGSSNDTIRGQAGNDLIYGEKGSDNISGNSGDDRFSYLALDHGGDTINDFNNIAGNNDIFNFKGSTFGGLPTGALAANRFAANLTGTATTADHRFIYETDAGILRFDSNGTGAGGVTLIATLTGAPVLTAADIVII